MVLKIAKGKEDLEKKEIICISKGILKARGILNVPAAAKPALYQTIINILLPWLTIFRTTPVSSNNYLWLLIIINVDQLGK